MDIGPTVACLHQAPTCRSVPAPLPAFTNASSFSLITFRPLLRWPVEATEVDVSEIVLKLFAASEHLQGLKQFIEVAGKFLAPPTNGLVSTYYDSEDHALRRHGLSLCIREANGRMRSPAIYPISRHRRRDPDSLWRSRPISFGRCLR